LCTIKGLLFTFIFKWKHVRNSTDRKVVKFRKIKIMCLENFFYTRSYTFYCYSFIDQQHNFTIVGRIVIGYSEKKNLGSNPSKFFCSNMFCKKSSVKIYCCRSAAIGWFIQCEKRSLLNHFVALHRPFTISFINQPVSSPTIFRLFLSILLDILPNIWRQSWRYMDIIFFFR